LFTRMIVIFTLKPNPKLPRIKQDSD